MTETVLRHDPDSNSVQQLTNTASSPTTCECWIAYQIQLPDSTYSKDIPVDDVPPSFVAKYKYQTRSLTEQRDTMHKQEHLCREERSLQPQNHNTSQSHYYLKPYQSYTYTQPYTEVPHPSYSRMQTLETRPSSIAVGIRRTPSSASEFIWVFVHHHSILCPFSFRFSNSFIPNSRQFSFSVNVLLPTSSRIAGM